MRIQFLAWTSFLCLFGLSLARAETPALLTDALAAAGKDQGRWAFTETSVQRDNVKKTERESVVQVDPSKPFAKQFTPLKIRGRAPNDKDLKRFRERGEKIADRVEKAERTGIPPKQRDTLGEALDLERANVTADDEVSTTFHVPLKKSRSQRFPPEKFEALVRVNKERRQLESISLRLLDSFRIKLVAKLKSGEFVLTFTTIDPQFPPVIARVEGEYSASLFFKSIEGSQTVVRTDYRRVKPFLERFEVNEGAIKALDF